MPIVKISSAIERYRYFARPEFNIHTLAGHGENGLPNIEFVSARILAGLQPVAADVVVDVGCGDGFLLARAAECGAKCIGIVPTEEEQVKLNAAVPGIDFRVGLAQRLPLASECASKVVCNSVLMLLEDQSNVAQALQEIARIARAGARVWVGEIPAADELSELHIYRGQSVVGLLLHDWRLKGFRAFLRSLKVAVNSLLGHETLLINSSRLFHSTPEQFIQLAWQSGLRIESWSKHKRLDHGSEVESRYRYNYVFTRA